MSWILTSLRSFAGNHIVTLSSRHNLAPLHGIKPRLTRSERAVLSLYERDIILVRIAGFDPAAPCARGRCSTRLSYILRKKMPRNEKHRSQQHAHYKQNKEYFAERTRIRRRENRAFVAALVAQSSCPCGERHPGCLDFHHRDESEKEFEISDAINHWGIDRLKTEISKCDIICSNCHRKLHWEQRQKMVIPQGFEPRPAVS